MARPLTQRQTEHLEYVRAYIAENERPPVLREIAAGMGISLIGAARAMELLRSKGWIDWERNRQRTIRILTPVERGAHDVCMRCGARDHATPACTKFVEGRGGDDELVCARCSLRGHDAAGCDLHIEHFAGARHVPPVVW